MTGISLELTDTNFPLSDKDDLDLSCLSLEIERGCLSISTLLVSVWLISETFEYDLFLGGDDDQGTPSVSC